MVTIEHDGGRNHGRLIHPGDGPHGRRGGAKIAAGNEARKMIGAG